MIRNNLKYQGKYFSNCIYPRKLYTLSKRVPIATVWLSHLITYQVAAAAIETSQSTRHTGASRGSNRLGTQGTCIHTYIDRCSTQTQTQTRSKSGHEHNVQLSSFRRNQFYGCTTAAVAAATTSTGNQSNPKHTYKRTQTQTQNQNQLEATRLTQRPLTHTLPTHVKGQRALDTQLRRSAQHVVQLT